MENLNAGTVKKALELCANEWYCGLCEFTEKECALIKKSAIALITSQEQRIKELTDENERLTTAITLWAKQCVELEKRCMKLGADIVTKMQEALEQRIHSKLSYHGWYLKETVIAEIAKEMLDNG